MKLKEDQIPEFIVEMRNLLSSLVGVKTYAETVSFSYVLVVENEEQKENVVKVANVLTQQAAQNYGIDLEIVPATEAEVEQSKELFKMAQNKKSSFEV